MKAHDVRTIMSGAPDWEEDDRSAAFWCPQPFNGGMLWIGRFRGRSPWERHPDTDELLHVLEGEVEVTVLTDAGEERAVIGAGAVFVVPRGAWHRLHAREQVTSVGVTPGPTEHSTAADPRAEAGP